MAVIVIDATENVPAADMVVGPSKPFMHPAFPVIGVEPHEVEPEFCRAPVFAAHLDLAQEQRRPHRRARSLGRAHPAREPAAEFINAIERQGVGLAGPET